MHLLLLILLIVAVVALTRAPSAPPAPQTYTVVEHRSDGGRILAAVILGALLALAFCHGGHIAHLGGFGRVIFWR